MSDLQIALGILAAVVTVIGTVAGGYWALTRLAVGQFNKALDERFQAQEKARIEGRRQSDERLQRMEINTQRLERELLELRAELPREYVRREDDIRRETVTNAKLDALAAKIDLVAERQSLRAELRG